MKETMRVQIGEGAAEGAPVNALVQYDAARKALQAAHSVDEVRDIKDKAEAVRAYARQAGDTEMQNWAVEIKLRAERRAGELLAEMKKAGILATLGDIEKQRERCVDKGTSVKTLDELEIRRHDAAKWQRLANVPEDKFELAIRRIKNSTDGLTGAALHRALNITTPTNEEVLQMFGEELNHSPPRILRRGRLIGVRSLIIKEPMIGIRINMNFYRFTKFLQLAF